MTISTCIVCLGDHDICMAMRGTSPNLCSFMDEEVGLLAQHDPLERSLPDEPHFILLARDPLAPGMTRLWAALRQKQWDRCPGILAAIIEHAKPIRAEAHKDRDHAQSARYVADRMADWVTVHMRAERGKGRINTSGEDYGI
jgi:hypothetical protein